MRFDGAGVDALGADNAQSQRLVHLVERAFRKEDTRAVNADDMNAARIGHRNAARRLGRNSGHRGVQTIAVFKGINVLSIRGCRIQQEA
jgi:hypothetical protein